MGRAKNTSTAVSSLRRRGQASSAPGPELREQVGRERDGDGGVPVGRFGMRFVSEEQVPGLVKDFYSLCGEDLIDPFHGRELWGQVPTVSLPADHPLFTGQQFISPTGLDVLRGRSGPRLGAYGGDARPRVVRVDGRDWLLDGHHRLARSRADGEPSVEVALADARALPRKLRRLFEVD